MVGGKKLTIALAITIPLLALGGGLAMASSEASASPAEDQPYSPDDGLVVAYSSSAAQYGCGDCAGECGRYGEGPCDGTCDGDCTGNCADYPGDGECLDAGQCAGNGDCIRSGDCERATDCDISGQCIGAGQCHDTAPKRLSNCARGSR